MKNFPILIFSLIISVFILSNAYANPTDNNFKASAKNLIKPLIGFLSSSDYLNGSTSEISLHNIGSQVTVTGLYLQALKQNDCTSLTSEANLGYGGTWVKGTVPNEGTVIIGGNIGAGTPGNPTNSSTPSPTEWCIKLGLVNGAASAASVAVSGNLISYAQATSISVTCNDTTEVCTASPVIQNFPQ